MSVSMETVEDEDEHVNKNIAPRNKTRLLELASGDDDSDDDIPNHIQIPAMNVSSHIYREKSTYSFP